MYPGEDFIMTTPSEIRALSFDFSDAFVDGDNIVTAVWTCSVSADSPNPDPNAGSHIGAPFANTAHIATATLQQCVEGVRYLLTCVATTASGQRAEFESYIDCNERD
jgi:hypothetical protein